MVRKSFISAPSTRPKRRARPPSEWPRNYAARRMHARNGPVRTPPRSKPGRVRRRQNPGVRNPVAVQRPRRGARPGGRALGNSPDKGLELKGFLRRGWRRERNAFQRKHAPLGAGAAGCRKAAKLAAGRQNAVTGNNQRHRIMGHGLTDVARSLRSGAELLGQRAVGRGVTPADPPRRRIYAFEKCRLLTKVEVEVGEVYLAAREIAPCCRNRGERVRRGRARRRAR